MRRPSTSRNSPWTFGTGVVSARADADESAPASNVQQMIASHFLECRVIKLRAMTHFAPTVTPFFAGADMERPRATGADLLVGSSTGADGFVVDTALAAALA